MHIKKGDQVLVIAGNNKGTRGEILEIDRKRNRVVVEGVNLRTKHQKPTQQSPQGERFQKEFPIHASNVMRIDPESGKPTRQRAAKAEKQG